VDSDGTVFDSMVVKHKRLFQPLAVELWGLHAVEREYCEIAETINLYSVHRGVNRFQGLVMALERLAAQTGVVVDGVTDLRTFVLSGLPPSAVALGSFNESMRSEFLSKVLEWSRRSDELYVEITDAGGNPPYAGARWALERLRDSAEIMIVSSSAREALLQDWSEAGLLPLVSRVAGQEFGSKSYQIESGLLEGGSVDRHCCLMIGDAPGDRDAALANGILFYPIIPGREDRSWQRFEAEAMGRFFEMSFAGRYQELLLKEFDGALRPDAPWPDGPVSVSEALKTTPVFQ
jgi:phosphoglycolate phosphatase-like HAD superfamily hydrolase